MNKQKLDTILLQVLFRGSEKFTEYVFKEEFEGHGDSIYEELSTMLYASKGCRYSFIEIGGTYINLNDISSISMTKQETKDEYVEDYPY